jgi:glutamyl-tRNA reductase
MQDVEILIVGLNHDTAPLEVRERVAFDRAALRDALKSLAGLSAVKEGVIVSTCNRVEVIAAAERAAFQEIEVFLRERDRTANDLDWREHFYYYSGEEAVRHLFRVASSLDSMVLGEPQILGQLKDYYVAAQDAGTIGAVLHRLFHRSFFAAKRVRSETSVGTGSVSVSSVAVDLARRIFDRLEDKTVMLIGAGKMGELVARQLRKSGSRNLMITNRTFERAVELAAEIRGNPIRFEDYPRYLKLADVVIGSAGSARALLQWEAVAEVLRERKHRPMFFIDLGVPRNFDPRIHEVDNAYLYNIDDLKEVASQNLNERSDEARKADRIVDEEVASFMGWLDSLDHVPTIVALRKKMEAIRKGEMEKSLGSSLRDLSESERRAIEDMTAAIINKILHGPVTRLKGRRGNREEALYADALRILFGLEDD